MRLFLGRKNERHTVALASLVAVLAACSTDSGEDRDTAASDGGDEVSENDVRLDAENDLADVEVDPDNDVATDTRDGDGEQDSTMDTTANVDVASLDTVTADTQPDEDTSGPTDAESAYANCVVIMEEVCARLYTSDCGPNTDELRPQLEAYREISDEASCLDGYLPERCEVLTEPFRRGYQRFDSEVANTCTAAVLELPCDAFFTFDPPMEERAGCGEYSIGLQEVTEPCFHDGSCVDGLFCPEARVGRVLDSEDELGICVAPRDEGGNCSNDNHCAESLVCSNRTCEPAE